MLVALITAAFTYLGSRKKAASNNESIYADHTKETWERIDKLTGERDDLKQEVIELRIKVAQMTATVDELNKQIGELRQQLAH